MPNYYLAIQIKTANNGRVTDLLLRQMTTKPLQDELVGLGDERAWDGADVEHEITANDAEVYVGARNLNTGTWQRGDVVRPVGANDFESFDDQGARTDTLRQLPTMHP